MSHSRWSLAQPSIINGVCGVCVAALVKLWHWHDPSTFPAHAVYVFAIVLLLFLLFRVTAPALLLHDTSSAPTASRVVRKLDPASGSPVQLPAAMLYHIAHPEGPQGHYVNGLAKVSHPATGRSTEGTVVSSGADDAVVARVQWAVRTQCYCVVRLKTQC